MALKIFVKLSIPVEVITGKDSCEALHRIEAVDPFIFLDADYKAVRVSSLTVLRIRL